MLEVAEVSDQQLDLRSEEIAEGHHNGNRNDRAEQVVEENRAGVTPSDPAVRYTSARTPKRKRA